MPGEFEIVSTWKQYGHLVLSQLEDQKEMLNKMDDKLNAMAVELAAQKVKNGIFGALGGCIPVTILIIIQLLTHR